MTNSPSRAGNLTGSRAAIERLFSPGSFERNVSVVDALRPVADGIGLALGQLALAWLASRSGVTCSIPGARTPEQAIQNADSADVELEEAALAYIGSVLDPGLAGSPGPPT